MKAEEIARRFQRRDSFKLADFIEIALPVYYLNVLAITIAHKKVPPIEEFILRSIALGVSDSSQLSAYLGLEDRVLQPALVGLLQTSDIGVVACTDGRQFRLTQKGKGALERAEIVTTEERPLPIYFDALTRKAAWYRNLELLDYRAMKHQGLFEINQSPPVRPRLGDLRIPEINRIAKAVYQSSETKRDLLAISAIESCKKVFLPAVALIYTATPETEIQVGVAVDGKLWPEHENVLAQNPSFQSFLLGKPLRELSAEFVSEEEGLTVELESSKAEQLRSASAAVEIAMADAEEALAKSSSAKEAQALRIKLRELEAEIETLRGQAKQLPVRDLYVFDHPPLLQDALTTASERLLIISPWITAQVVDADFLKHFEGLLKRGVSATIGHGISPNTRKNPHPNDVAAKAKLEALSKRYSNFKFVRLGNTHAKVLIKDHEFAAISSFNWLSYKGDPNRTFRDEQGTLYQRRDLVDKKFEDVVQLHFT